MTNAQQEVAVIEQGGAGLDRRTYIGGSRVSAILGLDPYGKTPLSEYNAIVSEIEVGPSPETLKFFEWRKEWEPIVIKRIQREFDAKIVAVNERQRDSDVPYFAAEIDFEWIDESGEIQNGEIKTVHPLAFSEQSGWGDAGTSDVPVNYAAQCMWGLGVKKRNVCILAALAGIDNLVFYRIERDDDVIENMREQCRRFWEDNVLPRIPPDPINMGDISSLMLKMRGRPCEADDELFENLRILQKIRGSIAAMEGDKEELMFKIGSAVLAKWQAAPDNPPKDNAIILRGGQQIASWSYQETVRLQVKELREAEPEIAAKYSKKTASRVLRFKKVK